MFLLSHGKPHVSYISTITSINGPSIKYGTLSECPGKRYGALHGGGGVLVIATFVIAGLAVSVTLIALVAMPVLGYISIKYKRKMNANPSMARELNTVCS